MKVVLGTEIVTWVSDRISSKMTSNDPIGIAIADDHGDILIGIIVDNFSKDSKGMDCSIAISDKKRVTKGAIKTLFDIGFNHIGAERITCYNENENPKAVKVAEMLGFKKEGCLRKASYNKTDLNIYGMLKSECKWI